MASRRILIINADDFGFAPGVNRGILEAHDAGTLESASMMVTAPAFDDAVALVRDRARGLGVGLHLDLIAGHPLTSVPTLADVRTGRFHALPELMRRALTGRIDVSDVRRECDAQLAALASAGIGATHLDSHRHSHALPGVLPGVLASAIAAGVRVIRRPLDRLSRSDPVASAKMFVLHASWRAALLRVDSAGRALLARSPTFRGIALQGAIDVESRLLALIDALPAGATELMLHPGYDDAVLAAQDPYRTEREREVAALCSVAVRERLERGDVRLGRFSDV